MKTLRISLGIVLLLVLSAFALSGFERWKTGAMMTAAAQNFLASLTPEQRAKATKSFEDANRLDWHFIPRVRQGLPFKELDPAQARLGFAFLNSGLGRRAYLQATTIMSLDAVLKELEKDMKGTPV